MNHLLLHLRQSTVVDLFFWPKKEYWGEICSYYLVTSASTFKKPLSRVLFSPPFSTCRSQSKPRRVLEKYSLGVSSGTNTSVAYPLADSVTTIPPFSMVLTIK